MGKRGSSDRGLTSRLARRLAGAGAGVAVTALVGCSTVDPYEVTCQELGSPDKLRETTLKLAKDDVQAKVRYQNEIERICADAPGDFRPVQQVKPEK